MSSSFLARIPSLSQIHCTKCLRNSSISKVLFSTRGSLQQNQPIDHADIQPDNLHTGSVPTSVTRPSLPLLTSRRLSFPSPKQPKQAWVETLSQMEDEKLGILDLHPEIFGVFPRIDVLWWNIYWQQMFRKINYTKVKSRAEVPGGGRKPWPQKGTGRARHGSVTSPLWHKGGKSHGPRGPKSYFFMLPDNKRVLGLRTALTVKYAQDNLHIVDSLDLPDDDPKYLEELVESRGWGLSVLFVDDTDVISRNLALATDSIKPYNVMPVYGLNVYSMLKHETLVLTLDALNKIELKLLQHMNSQDHRDKKFSKSSTTI